MNHIPAQEPEQEIPEPPIKINIKPSSPSYTKIIYNITKNKLISNPFSYVGLRISMNSSDRQYFGPLDCADSIIVKEGAMTLWRGLPLDIVSVLVTNQFYSPALAEPQKIIKKIFWYFVLVNLTYCRLLYKLHRSMTIKQIPQLLIKSYTHKNGLIGLAGAALIVSAQTIFAKLLNYLNKRPQVRYNFVMKINRGVQMVVILFPWICIGCKMIQKSFRSDTILSGWSLKGLAITCLGAFVQKFASYLFP